MVVLSPTSIKDFIVKTAQGVKEAQETLGKEDYIVSEFIIEAKFWMTFSAEVGVQINFWRAEISAQFGYQEGLESKITAKIVPVATVQGQE